MIGLQYAVTCHGPVRSHWLATGLTRAQAQEVVRRFAEVVAPFERAYHGRDRDDIARVTAPAEWADEYQHCYTVKVRGCLAWRSWAVPILRDIDRQVRNEWGGRR